MDCPRSSDDGSFIYLKLFVLDWTYTQGHTLKDLYKLKNARAR